MNILILSAATGGGHIQASKALKNGIEEKYPESRVEVIDGLKYISSFLDIVISKSYLVLAKYLKTSYKNLYKLTDKNSFISFIVDKLTLKFSSKLMPLIKEVNADVIITTHPFLTGMISALKKTGKIDALSICTMTDYECHCSWLHSNIDIYSVAWNGMIPEMISHGIKKDIIHDFGIPVDPKFFHTTKDDGIKLKKELGLDEDKTTILVMAGSFGVNNIIEIYEEISKIPLDFQVVILTGNNKALYRKIEKRIEGSNKDTRIVEFTREVYRYMAMADVLITKPGGLTVSEALASNLPLIVFDSIPGQEEGNAKFLIDNGMAITIGKGKNCKNEVERLLKDKGKIEEMAKRCQEFDKSGAIDNLVDIMSTYKEGEAAIEVTLK